MEKLNQYCYFNNLPPEIITAIAMLLEMNDMARLALVSKKFHYIVRKTPVIGCRYFMEEKNGSLENSSVMLYGDVTDTVNLQKENEIDTKLKFIEKIQPLNRKRILFKHMGNVVRNLHDDPSVESACRTLVGGFSVFLTMTAFILPVFYGNVSFEGKFTLIVGGSFCSTISGYMANALFFKGLHSIENYCGRKERIITEQLNALTDDLNATIDEIEKLRLIR